MIYFNDRLNLFIQEFNKWKYTLFTFTPIQKRNFVSVLMLFCVFTLLLLIAFDPKMYENRQMILIIVFIALGNVIWLQYLNHGERKAISPMKAKLPYLSSLRSSPFNPKSEQISKQIIQETSEHLESNSKNLAKKTTFNLDYNNNSLESSLIKRKLNFSSRPQDNISMSYSQTIQAPESKRFSNPVQSTYGRDTRDNLYLQSASRQSQPYQPKLITQKKHLKEFSPPRTFVENKEGYKSVRSMAPPSGSMVSRNNEYSSTSPLRGGAITRQHTATYFSGQSRILNDEYLPPVYSEFNEKKDEEAKATLETLAIKFVEFMKWKENCQRWFCERLILKVLDENVRNIKEINKILQYFDKRLHEYEGILKIDQSRATEGVSQKSSSQFVTIDELLNYEVAARQGAGLWTSSQLNVFDTARANGDLLYNIGIRRYFEKYFEIEGYKTFEIRTYVLERLFKLRESFQKNFIYHDGEILKKRFPTDTQILANLFFKWLNNETVSQNDKARNIYRNFVYKSNTGTLLSNLSGEDVYFQQHNFEGTEPHYDIISTRKVYPVLSGKDNLFAAIVLFAWFVKSNKQGNLNLEQSNNFTEFLKEVIPSYY